REELLACSHFRIERLRPQASLRFEAAPYERTLICTRGSFAGSAWLIPSRDEPFSIDAPGSEWLLAYAEFGGRASARSEL
ncbi:MAG: hypothetical protein ACRD45_11485, partial [Bryobacteraceae bacterium]